MSKKKVVVIEDECDLAMMTQARLESSGYEVFVVSDGEEGVKKVQQELPSIVLLDIVMPKLDGHQVCTALKSDPSTKDIPIIILTASGKKDTEERCLDQGADYFMRKPFDSQQLLEKIKELTGE
ncbi:MAG: response regulator [Candidatus Omnitrophica bacterium]|nr:response regulator [Candidatus Omnitrophota bacterium]